MTASRDVFFWLVSAGLATSPASPASLGPGAAYCWLMIFMRVDLGEAKGCCWAVRVDFEWVWVGLDLICARCATGLAAA